MKGRKPSGSRFRRAFLAAVAGASMLMGGVGLDHLPKNPVTDTQTISTFDVGTSAQHGYNIAPSDQFWKHTLGMKSADERANALLDAARDGDSWRTAALMQYGGFNTAATGAEAMAIAAGNGSGDVVNALLHASVDPTANDGAALVAAVRGGHNDIALQLMQLGVRGSSMDSQALVIAALQDNTSLISALIVHGADVNAQNGNNDVVQLLLAQTHTYSFNVPSYVGPFSLPAFDTDLAGNNGGLMGPFQMGAHSSLGDNYFGNTPTTFTLRDVNINANDGAALRAAVAFGHTDVVKTLLDAGANVNVKDGMPLALSIYNGDMDTFNQLIASGANVNAGDGLALYIAVTFENTQMTQTLMTQGANPALRDGKILEAAKTATNPAIAKLVQGTTTPAPQTPQGPR